MRTNIEIDDQLIAYVQEKGGHKTKREAVEAALREYRRRLAMRALLDMAGTVEFDLTAAQLRGKEPIPDDLPPRAAEPLAPYGAKNGTASKASGKLVKGKKIRS